LNPPDGVAPFASAEGLPCDADGPVFSGPWQAQAFALAVRLSEAGFFTWREWADELGAVLRQAAARGRIGSMNRPGAVRARVLGVLEFQTGNIAGGISSDRGLHTAAEPAMANHHIMRDHGLRCGRADLASNNEGTGLLHRYAARNDCM
jgi:hypothetical protein